MRVRVDLSQVAAKEDRPVDEKPVDILSFMSLCKGIELTPVERFVLKCTYGLPLDAEEKRIEIWDMFVTKIEQVLTEVEFFGWLKERGAINQKCPEDMLGKNFGEVVLILGRRSGKSFIAGTIGSYELYSSLCAYNPHGRYGIIEGEEVNFISVATKEDQAAIIFNFSRQIIRSNDFFKPYVLFSPRGTEYSSQLVLRTKKQIVEGDRHGTLFIKFEPAASKGLRGKGNKVICLDEIAHFVKETKRITSDQEIYNAVTPSVATFTFEGRMEGKILLISSPLGQFGVLHEKYKDSFNRPGTMLMLQIPSWIANPRRLSSEFLQKQHSENPKVFLAEFGAQFNAERVASFVEDDAWYRECFTAELRPQVWGARGIKYFFGGDIGFKKDSTAFAVGHVDEQGRIVTDFLEEWDPADIKKDIEVEDIVGRIADLDDRFGIADGVLDQYSGTVIVQMLTSRGVKSVRVADISDKMHSEMFRQWKTYMQGSKFRCFRDDFVEKRVIPQLQRLREEKLSQYHIRVIKVAGGKDDVADALARMVWVAHAHQKDKSGRSSTGQRRVGYAERLSKDPRFASRYRENRHGRYYVGRLRPGPHRP